jgi:hypothetical protein
MEKTPLDDVANDLPEQLRTAIRPMVEATKANGWTSVTVHWQEQGKRKVGVVATSPNGTRVSRVFDEIKLAEELPAFFK